MIVAKTALSQKDMKDMFHSCKAMSALEPNR